VRIFRPAMMLAISLSALLWPSAQCQASPAGQGPSLGDIARQNRKSKTPSDAAKPETKQLVDHIGSAGSDSITGAEGQYQYQSNMQQLLAQREFEALDKAAGKARSSKARFRGGIWQLYIFYEAVSAPVGGSSASEADWNALIETLKKWTALRPQSITARVALAEAYNNWGSKARGTGYGDSVTDQGWQLLATRVEQAERILVDAAKLPERCPYWFEAMQHVAVVEGWDKSQALALLNQAVASEPGYYHFYREYTNFILPRWYGEEGEAAAFAKESSDHVGGSEGAFLYFELSTVIVCHCDTDRSRLASLSWEKIKRGYAAMEQMYGTSELKMNRFAYMAYLADDRASARPIFEQLGTHWDPSVWGNQQLFEEARSWSAGGVIQTQAIPPKIASGNMAF
jgi:hypothetical protein